MLLTLKQKLEPPVPEGLTPQRYVDKNLNFGKLSISIALMNQLALDTKMDRLNC